VRSRRTKSALTTRFEDLVLALVAQVVGIYCGEPVAGLLIGYRWWPCGEDFLAECVRVGVIVVTLDTGAAR
jgi:hypothetical protein